jgi:hypothetical protein
MTIERFYLLLAAVVALLVLTHSSYGAFAVTFWPKRWDFLT